ncbi:hypothetical protein CF327_g7441 [Tilletia walkeri]|uniref:tRNA-splicing endonuclease subunit Sen2 n=1 Tax=Tilletia walkeri TaxID=117179 RepID=A0A8X7N4D8_9BASI|nr:hypothetical protein CF327_g7441 [Tilletia walkeri]KAE8264405.1 hypothetical protein A4X09_0g6973 [Tilletia walkeri]
MAAANNNTGARSSAAKRATHEKKSLYARLLPLSIFSPTQQKQQQQQCLFTARYDSLLNTVWLDFNASTSTASHIDNLGLWHSGFFGKGTLSRSEPTWHTRTLASVQIQRARQQGRLSSDKLTPEEMTAWRRRERMEAKIERAKLAVKAGTMLKDGIVALGGSLEDEEDDDDDDPEAGTRETIGEAGLEGTSDNKPEEGYRTFVPGLIHLRPSAKGKGKVADDVIRQAMQAGPQRNNPAVSQASLEDIAPDEEEDEDDFDLLELERMQLSLQETFFLAGMLGVLDVRDEQDRLLDVEDLYHTLLRSSLSPALRSQPSLQTSTYLRPDNPFLVNYIAYHHFRSLGWVVKTGIKFCVDLLIYKRGPVFSHAEFAVLVMPVYEDPDDAKSYPFESPLMNCSGELDWIKFHTYNRVNTHVQKTLILAHVHIPALSRTPASYLSNPAEMVNHLKAGRLWSVREVVIRRWSPARMRP